jgi:3-oxoacyl-[acyl-carrier-protein] synthase-3
MGIGIIGIGKKMADNVITNEDMCKIVDTSDEWIVERTGVHERRIATTQKSLDLALEATKEALKGIDYDSISLVIFATCTPDILVPSMGALVKMHLGLKNAVVFDLNSACSGFIYALWTAEAIMEAESRKAGGKMKRAIVIGGERISRITDWEDRGSCILFGDGAGAAVLENRDNETGIIASFLKNYDDVDKALWCGMEYRQNPFSKDEEIYEIKVRMSGTRVFKFAVSAVGEVMEKTLLEAGLSADDVDYYIPHQANLRIIKTAAGRFGQPLDKFQISIDRTGNVSAASVPMALYDAIKEGKVKTGDTVMLVGFGGGLSAGAVLMKMW